MAGNLGNPVGETHHRYAKEFRDEAVRLFRKSGKPLRPFCAELGIATESLRKWVKNVNSRLHQRAQEDYPRRSLRRSWCSARKGA